MAAISTLREVRRLAIEAKGAQSSGAARKLRVRAYAILVRQTELPFDAMIRIVKRFFDGERT